MRIRPSAMVLGATVLLALPAGQAWAHWCDDLWASSYNITVRPDSDTSPKEVYVQNNMGYQLPSFTLTASGGVTLTAPTFKVPGTLMPGEKGTWKISAGSPAKIESITFSVSFGNSGESKCYPTKGANAVMIVKNDGTIYPTGTLPGLDSPQNPGCTGDFTQARTLEYSAMTDWEDVDGGIDKLLNLYCAGRASWGSTDGVVQSNCKDNKSTSCPAASSKPASGTGSKWDYNHLWAAGELAIRKGSMGDRLAVFRDRLKCALTDGDTGFAGYALFVLGYLGADDGAKSAAQAQVTAGGDIGTIGKAALYMMGDTTQKADVQSGVQSSSVFVKVACAAALGIVDNDDSSVTSAIIPQVKWNEPDTSDDGKGMYAAHILELVASARRGWVPKGVGTGPVTFYGETGAGGSAGSTGGTPGGTGGSVGSGGTGAAGVSGNKDAGSADGRPAAGGTTGVGGGSGAAGAPGTGGTTGGGSTVKGGASGSGGTGPNAGGTTGPAGSTSRTGGTPGASGGAGPGGAGAGGVVSAGGSQSEGGSSGSVGSSSGSKGGSSSSNGGSTGSSSGQQGSGGSITSSTAQTPETSGCKCNLGGSTHASAVSLFALAGLALAMVRRRRR